MRGPQGVSGVQGMRGPVGFSGAVEVKRGNNNEVIISDLRDIPAMNLSTLLYNDETGEISYDTNLTN